MTMFFRKRTISALAVRPRWKKTYVTPKLTISGNWLNKAGFEVGEQVKIEVSNNKLIITKND